MMTNQIELEIPRRLFNDAYLPYLDADLPRVQVFFGGSASGKSIFAAQRAVLDVATGGRNYLIARNVARTIRPSIYNEINKAIRRYNLEPYFTANKNDMVITCANGFQMMFAGLDDVEKIKSITPAKGVITDVLIEEATETERNDVKQLNKRLRGKASVPKRMTLLFNPIPQTHWI